MARISGNIDKLTNSILNRLSGDSFDTEVIEFKKSEIKTLNKGWKFNWSKELAKGAVYKLVIMHYPDVIQGLVCLVDKKDHIFMNLIETAPHNFGKNKISEGVLGNLVAFACKMSLDKGYDGFVAFESKTKLIEHYKTMLKAELIGGNRMVINEKAAIFLVNKYYNK